MLLHNGLIVRIICSSCWLLMSHRMWGELYTAAFYPGHWPIPCQSGVISHEDLRQAYTSTSLHTGSIICLLWSAACPPSQPALAPFSHIKTLLSSPMFTELPNPNQDWDGVKLGSNPPMLPVALPSITADLLVYLRRRLSERKTKHV